MKVLAAAIIIGLAFNASAEDSDYYPIKVDSPSNAGMPPAEDVVNMPKRAKRMCQFPDGAFVLTSLPCDQEYAKRQNAKREIAKNI